MRGSSGSSPSTGIWTKTTNPLAGSLCGSGWRRCATVTWHSGIRATGEAASGGEPHHRHKRTGRPPRPSPFKRRMSRSNSPPPQMWRSPHTTPPAQCAERAARGATVARSASAAQRPDAGRPRPTPYPSHLPASTCDVRRRWHVVLFSCGSLGSRAEVS